MQSTTKTTQKSKRKPKMNEEFEEKVEPEEVEEKEEVKEEVKPEEERFSKIETAMEQTNAMLQRFIQNSTPAKATTEAKPVDEIVVPEFDFTQDVDMDDVMTNPKMLNKMLNQAAQHGAKFAFAEAMSKVPTRVGKDVERRVTEAQQVEKFFDRNEDVADFRPYFSTVMEQEFGKNPNLTVAQLLKETANTVRKDLKLQAPDKSRKSGVVAPGGGTGTRGGEGDKVVSEAQKALNHLKGSNKTIHGK